MPAGRAGGVVQEGTNIHAVIPNWMDGRDGGGSRVTQKSREAEIKIGGMERQKGKEEKKKKNAKQAKQWLASFQFAGCGDDNIRLGNTRYDTPL